MLRKMAKVAAQRSGRDAGTAKARAVLRRAGVQVEHTRGDLEAAHTALVTSSA